jgi:hypothetical protein
MVDSAGSRLPVVDGLELDDRHRGVLCPDELLRDDSGKARRLPRFFYEVDSWQTAQSIQLTEYFSLWEFLTVDVRETEPLRTFPRYIPCAVTALAAHLQLFREAADTFIHISANGGYRSPKHALTNAASTHCWGTAVNIYRIGDDYLDTPEKIERYARLAEKTIPGCWIRPYGAEKGFADDHLHIDIGYMIVIPREAPSENGGAERDVRK